MLFDKVDIYLFFSTFVNKSLRICYDTSRQL